MSLLKKLTLTEKKLAANRQNQKLCHGPTTDEVRQRIREAHLRHGFYAKAEDIALRSLGEQPEQFQELLEGLWNQFSPAGALQEGMVIRLARAVWLMNRADRMQEGQALRQARDASIGRDNRQHAHMMRLTMAAESLRRLAQSVAAEHYVTQRADLDAMKNLQQEGVAKEMGEIALALFYQLQAPGVDEDGIDPEEKTRRVMTQIRGIFGLGPLEEEAEEGEDAEPDSNASDADAGDGAAPHDDAYPNITPAEWEARERARQLLENILTRQVEACEAERQAILKESLEGPSPYERAAEIAPLQSSALVLRRMQDSYFREVRRTTKLLMKMQRTDCEIQAFENAGSSTILQKQKELSA